MLRYLIDPRVMKMIGSACAMTPHTQSASGANSRNCQAAAMQ